MSKYLIKVFILFCLLFFLFFAGKNQKGSNTVRILEDSYYHYNTLDKNQIFMALRNTGNTDWKDYDQRITWSQIDGYNTIVFDQGLWVIGKINEIPHWSYGKWSSIYSPGPLIDGQAAMLVNPDDSLRYRVYKISEGDDDSNPDYQEWPVDFSAPLDDQGNPKIFGDQTLWTIYNGMDSTISYREGYFDTIAVMPVEVNQTAYCRGKYLSDAEDIFSNVIFLEYQVINKGEESIDSTFIGFWTDIDFLDAFYNPPGIDTINQLGYCWYSEDSSVSHPGIIPPAVGYVQIYGPVIPSIGNDAIFKGRLLDNHKNSYLYSFRGIEDDASLDPLFGTPYSVKQAWNIVKGLDLNGQIIIDPTVGQSTRFPLSGDPATHTGWIYNNYTGGGAGFVMFNGPLTMAPGDTQWVMYALIPAQGGDRFQSIEAMRKKSSILRETPYDSLVSGSRAIGIWYAGEAEASVNRVFITPQIDALEIQATFPTSEPQNFTALAVIKNVVKTYTDSLPLYDDGQHHDLEAGDDIWGNVLPPVDTEDYFTISIYAQEFNSQATYYSDELTAFTSVGPVIIKSYSIVTADSIPNPGDRIGIQLTLENVGLTTSAIDITSNIFSLDTCATVSTGLENPSYGDIESGQSVIGDRTIFINFSDECPDSTWISFKVNIYSYDTLYWTDTFAVFIQSEPNSIIDTGQNIPETYALHQNYPNPFNPATAIGYQLPTVSNIELSIYNILGQKVATLLSGRQPAGYYQVEWDASDFASGVYYYRLSTSAGFFQTKKLILLR